MALYAEAMPFRLPRPDDDQAATFPSRLKFLREARGYGVNELNSKAGLYTGSVSRFENGKRGSRISAEKLRKLADALDASRDWLETGGSEDGRIFNEDPTTKAQVQEFVKDEVHRQLDEALAQFRPEHGRKRPTSDISKLK